MYLENSASGRKAILLCSSEIILKVLVSQGTISEYLIQKEYQPSSGPSYHISIRCSRVRACKSRVQAGTLPCPLGVF